MADRRQAQLFNQAQFSAQAFGAKYQNKNEVYRFLATDCEIYLPPKATCTIWFLKAIAAGKRRKIKCTEVKKI